MIQLRNCSWHETTITHSLQSEVNNLNHYRSPMPPPQSIGNICQWCLAFNQKSTTFTTICHQFPPPQSIRNLCQRCQTGSQKSTTLTTIGHSAPLLYRWVLGLQSDVNDFNFYRSPMPHPSPIYKLFYFTFNVRVETVSEIRTYKTSV